MHALRSPTRPALLQELEPRPSPSPKLRNPPRRTAEAGDDHLERDLMVPLTLMNLPAVHHYSTLALSRQCVYEYMYRGMLTTCVDGAERASSPTR